MISSNEHFPFCRALHSQLRSFGESRTFLLLAAIYIFYTIPLTFATGLVDPARWADIFGQEWNPSEFYTKYLSGILPALLWTGFFALCPLMFKSLANFGSNALSVQGAGKVLLLSCCHLHRNRKQREA